MVVNLTVQSIDGKDVSASYTMGFASENVKSTFTNVDSGYTATSIVVYGDTQETLHNYGVSQSLVTIQVGLISTSQAEIDAIETAVALAAGGSYVAPSGTALLGATTSDMGALIALDTKIGVNSTPVIRTNNPIIGANAINANIDAVDAAIGADAELSVVTRTTGQLVVNSTVMSKFDAIDAGIGFDTQLSVTPKLIATSKTIYQNLDALDTYCSTRVIKKTIGGVGVAGCDFNFVTAANILEQIIDLGAIVPAKARIVDFFSFTDITFTGAVSLGVEYGTTSSGAELKVSANLIAASTISQFAIGGSPVIDISATALHVYASATPGANWSLATAGKLSIYITINDVTNV